MVKGALARKDVLGSMMVEPLILQIIVLSFVSFLILSKSLSLFNFLECYFVHEFINLFEI